MGGLLLAFVPETLVSCPTCNAQDTWSPEQQSAGTNYAAPAAEPQLDADGWQVPPLGEVTATADSSYFDAQVQVPLLSCSE